MVTVNRTFHNTLWVPGHFHFYLLLGLLPMLIGFTYFLAGEGDSKEQPKATGQARVLCLFDWRIHDIHGILASGASSGIPRRWAVHLLNGSVLRKWAPLLHHW
ncbi:MAG: cbb3-type cytochrome c oxidase subunit I [Nitrosomonas sp.]|nr:cbb3-type cytochrome c oxidase subunit I [Nitrosomonas sp.]